jgi:hypothetical protein
MKLKQLIHSKIVDEQERLNALSESNGIAHEAPLHYQ